MTTIHKFFCFNLWVLTKGMFCFYHCNLKLQISFGFESKQQKWRTLSWGALGRPSWGDRLLNFVEMPTMPMSPSPAREKWFWLTHLSLEWGLYWCTVNSYSMMHPAFGHCPNSNWTPPHSNGHYFRQYLTILKSCMLPDSSSHFRCLKPSWSPKRAMTKYAQIVLRRGFPKTVLGLYIFQYSAAA